MSAKNTPKPPMPPSVPPSKAPSMSPYTAPEARVSPTATELPRRHIIQIMLLSLLTLVMTLPGLSNLPVIDRDEARFAVASVQMAESGDFVSPRFQDEARNKKPVGSYWAQAVMVNLFADPGERKIWAQRLPSVLAALLAVLATYWAAVPMVGRRGAFIAGGLLAVSALFVFEGHIAKTDALLCASGTLVFASFAHLRQGGGRVFALLFWTAMGLAVMIKGPVIPGLAILTLCSLALWERDTAWMRKLLFWPGPIIFAAIVLPWSILIFQATDGQFFKDALIGDFGQKLVSGQESHGNPPGSYMLTLPIAFWPASLFLIMGLSFAVRAARAPRSSAQPVVRAMRLALSWAVPYWIILEIIPTKLPNYLLPIYPALAVMAAGAILTLMATKEFAWTRRIGALLAALVSTALIVGLLVSEAQFGNNPTWSIGVCFAALLVMFYAAFALWTARARHAVIAALSAGVILQPFVYQFLLPSLSDLRPSPRVAAALQAKGIALPREGGPTVLSPTFTEPSLVYHLGSKVLLGGRVDVSAPLTPGTILVLDLDDARTAAFIQSVDSKGNCRRPLDKIDGYNYSDGDAVALSLSEITVCPPTPAVPQETETSPQP